MKTNTIRMTWASDRQFIRQHGAICTVIALSLIATTQVLVWPVDLNEAMLALLVGGMLTWVAIGDLKRYTTILNERIAAGGSGPVWQVRVGERRLGEIPDAQVAQIRRDIYLSLPHHLAQAGVLAMRVAGLWIVFLIVLVIALVVVVWLMKIGLLFGKGVALADVQGWSILQKVAAHVWEPKENPVSLFQPASRVMFFVADIFIGLRLITSYRPWPKAVSVFEAAIEKRLRQRFDSQARGKVRLYYLTSSTFVESDEWRLLRDGGNDAGMTAQVAG